MQDETYYNYEQHIKFTLGHAGTGKSTKLAEEANEKTIVLTPTHKAKDVLKAKGVANVFTIHAVLKLVPTLDQNFRQKGKMQKLVKLGAVDLSTIETVIIDEFSMIPTHIMDLLLELLPATAKVSVYGDPYQLPPVDGDKIDPEFYAREIEVLDVQYRAEAPEVVETFTRFVDFLEFGAKMDLTINPAIKKGSLKDFNPDTDRALAYTNKEVIAINTRIANLLDLPSEISIGESVIINGIIGELVEAPIFNPMTDERPPLTIYPSCVSKGVIMEGQKLVDQVERVERDISKFRQAIPHGVKHYIRVEDEVYGFYGDINHYEHSKEFKNEVETSQLALIREFELPEDTNLKDWCRMNKNEFTRARGKAWGAFIGHTNLSFDLRRPYATTVHKSQGSEFDTVYIAKDDIMKAIRNGYYEDYARLMYVALSRAIKKVVII